MSGSFDIVGVGCAAVDDIVFVSVYPAPDSKQRVVRRERHCGGLIASALVAAGRLGASCCFAGTLGYDTSSDEVLRCLGAEGIDVSNVIRSRGAQPVNSVIIVDATTGTRTILFQPFANPNPEPLAEAVVRAGRVLAVDDVDGDRALAAANVAARLGVPVVADLEMIDSPNSAMLLARADHVIVSESYAASVTGRRQPADAVRDLWRPTRSLVAVTAGKHGCWYRSADSPDTVEHEPAYAVEVTDTTGCGDAFHGAYAAGLAWGWQPSLRIALASATATLTATKIGGQASLPTREAVERLIGRELGRPN
jgi:sulfofructose kinase